MQQNKEVAMGAYGENPNIRRDVGEALNKVEGRKDSSLARRTMSEQETHAMLTGLTRARVENELPRRGYNPREARLAVQGALETFVML